jgi:peptidyl-prolyl cis-trans isomerase A (cyclophilin A)
MKLTNALLAPALAVAFAAAAFAQTSSQPAKAPAASSNPTVVMDTSMGRITCQLFPKQAPKAVANFIGLAKGTRDWIDPRTGMTQHLKPYYNGTLFHRVIPGFMIQGGDPTGTGTGNPGYMFVDEFDPSLNFDRPGRLAMANSGPNTNGSQFFITEEPYSSLNQHYTIFGQCDDASVQVVKAITGVPRNDQDKPRIPVVLKKVTIVPAGQPLPPLPGAAAPKPAPKPAAPKQ